MKREKAVDGVEEARKGFVGLDAFAFSRPRPLSKSFYFRWFCLC